MMAARPSTVNNQEVTDSDFRGCCASRPTSSPRAHPNIPRAVPAHRPDKPRTRACGACAGHDPALLDTLPFAAGILDDAPARIKENLLAAFQVQALYNNNDNQVTIRATLTHDTPRTIAALLADPRTDDDSPADPATSTNAMSHLGSAPMAGISAHDDPPARRGRLPRDWCDG